MPERQREESLERLLPEVLAGRATPAGEICADAETIAAWTDGTLTDAEAAVLERHVVDCGRCQALVGTLVRTAPAPPVAEPLWRRWRLPWLVPVATAATAAALWVAAPNRTSVAIQSEAGKETPAGFQAADSAAAPTETGAPDVANSQSKARADRNDRSPSASPPATAALEALRAEDRAIERPQNEAPNAPVEGEASATKLEGARAAADGVAAPAAPAPAAQPFARRQAFALRQGPLIEIKSPDSAGEWRILGERQIEWSRTGGAEWEAATIATQDGLTAGSAPSGLVCWIVGRRGAVFVTTNGATFSRVPFPETVDLVTVSAADAQNATVTSADGRSWRTPDQGRSWTPVQ